MSERFGFTVRRTKHWQTKERGWSVSLPHQCDQWDIVGRDYTGVPDHAKAVADLERFLAEGAAALAALRDEQEFGEEE